VVIVTGARLGLVIIPSRRSNSRHGLTRPSGGVKAACSHRRRRRLSRGDGDDRFRFTRRIRRAPEPLGLAAAALDGGELEARSPIDGRVMARVACASPEAAGEAVARAQAAFLAWRTVPAPWRGELVRLFGEVLRAEKAAQRSAIRWPPGA
jgi:hypothetical protein